MKTPKDYIDKGKSIVPCEGKKPYHKDWDNKDFTINDFKPGDNIGLKLVDDFLEKTILKPSNLNYPISRTSFINSLK